MVLLSPFALLKEHKCGCKGYTFLDAPLCLMPTLLLWHNTCSLHMTLVFRKSDQFFAQIFKATTTGTTMTAKVINFEEKRKERDREQIVAKINEYYRQLREQGWIVCRPEKEK